MLFPCSKFGLTKALVRLQTVLTDLISNNSHEQLLCNSKLWNAIKVSTTLTIHSMMQHMQDTSQYSAYAQRGPLSTQPICFSVYQVCYETDLTH